MARKLVIDTCSLIDFFRYFYFDKKSGAQVSKKLTDFLISKIKNDEIIIIDKVDEELARISSEYPSMRKEIASKVVNTDMHLTKVMEISTRHYLTENEKHYGGDRNRIEADRTRYESKDADLYLIAHSLYIMNSGDEAILVTDETTNQREYTKLFPKIPTICRVEHVRCENMAAVLFETYKKQLKFDLEIVPEQQNPQVKP